MLTNTSSMELRSNRTKSLDFREDPVGIAGNKSLPCTIDNEVHILEDDSANQRVLSVRLDNRAENAFTR